MGQEEFFNQNLVGCPILGRPSHQTQMVCSCVSSPHPCWTLKHTVSRPPGAQAEEPTSEAGAYIYTITYSLRPMSEASGKANSSAAGSITGTAEVQAKGSSTSESLRTAGSGCSTREGCGCSKQSGPRNYLLCRACLAQTLAPYHNQTNHLSLIN